MQAAPIRITLRLIVALIVVIAAVAYLSAYFQVGGEKRKQEEEVERRSRLLAESLQESVEPLLPGGPSRSLQRLVARFGNRERLAGVAIYDAGGTALAITASLDSALSTPPDIVPEAIAKGVDMGAFDRIAEKDMHVYVLPLRSGPAIAGALVIFHDAGHIRSHLAEIWRRAFSRFLIQAVLISLVTLLVIRWSIVGPIAQMAEWMKQLRAGEPSALIALPREDLFAPIAREASSLAKHFSAAKRAAEEEARVREVREALWTPERLEEHVRSKLRGRPLVLVSNREPYLHRRRGRKVECIVPAGGVVTACEPVMRACGGVWIAHGAGDADWETADERGRLKVPPESPSYVLRRVALTKEEESGYYYGFANEGLWPLCHIAHTRPTFRAEDWAQYQHVNRKFAQVTAEELEGIEEPCVLVQDCHFSLFPRLLKELRPDARIALFWHIPWPNPEAFGICPWQKELLYGILGADVVGFHTQFFCNNFLETVDRVLECRIDWERFGVTKGGHHTIAKAIPISVAVPGAFQDVPVHDEPSPDREALLKDLGVKAKYLAVGVERLDYTKGILERLQAIERFLEKYPHYQKQFVFVQLGAPSRTHIKRYSEFLSEVHAEVERVNWKLTQGDWRPVVFLEKHHTHREILPFYKCADLCVVASLSDGMNLVAKEFVAARDDGGGVLILSQFAGASRELRDALIVNPYDTEQTAEAIRYGLEMPADERSTRMRRLRDQVQENSVYRWAGDLITELTRVRLEEQSAAPIT
ncbi:MAG TPA: trehalose-6-phosphate synthase [Gemmatimonadales bacterium]|nr:trehalose-6-phosphate synthase [Gemmatimonadales bacterium]